MSQGKHTDSPSEVPAKSKGTAISNAQERIGGMTMDRMHDGQMISGLEDLVDTHITNIEPKDVAAIEEALDAPEPPAFRNTWCPPCRDYLFGGPKFCSACGREAVPYPQCGKCGSEQSPNAKFCGKCGNSLEVK